MSTVGSSFWTHGHLLQVAILALKDAEVKSLSVKGTGAKGCTLKRQAFQSAPVTDCININLLCQERDFEKSESLLLWKKGRERI